MASPIQIVPEETPNPLSNKFTVNRTVVEDPHGRDFPHAEAAKASPLAQELFQLPGVTAVYMGRDFVTVTLKPGTDWWSQRALVAQTLETFFNSGKPVLNANAPVEDTLPKRALSPTEIGILRVLETEITPAVAMDGGFINFVGFEQGVVKLELRGACHSCPSALVTLKAGVETRLKQEFPDILRVEAV